MKSGSRRNVVEFYDGVRTGETVDIAMELMRNRELKTGCCWLIFEENRDGIKDVLSSYHTDVFGKLVMVLSRGRLEVGCMKFSRSVCAWS